MLVASPQEREPAFRLSTLQAILPGVLLVANLALFGTFAVYSANAEEFQVGYREAAAVLLPSALLAIAALAVLMKLLPPPAAQVALGILIALGFLTYVQGNFLLWNYGVLDGSGLDFGASLPAWVDGAVWLVGLALAVRFRRALAGRAVMVSGLLLAVQVAAAGVLAWRAAPDGGGQSLTVQVLPESLTRLSSERNVLHLVLDAFQADIFQELLDGQPDLASSLRGFTFFADAIAPSNVTFLSVPASLTGTAFAHRMPISRYKRETLEGENLHSVLESGGFEVDLAVAKGWLRPSDFLRSYYRIPTPYTTLLPHRRNTALRLADLSLFRQVPHSVKPWVYNSESWRLSDDSGPQFDHHAHLAFLSELTEQLTLGDEGAVYKWIHVLTPHGPLAAAADCSYPGARLPYTRENFLNQSRCVVAAVVRLLQRLETLGVYDSSLILIHGDHGGSVPFRMRAAGGEIVDSAALGLRYPGGPLPLLLVKPAGATGPLRRSERSVQLTDIATTVCDLLAVECPFPGSAMFGDTPASGERHYYSSSSQKNDAAARDFFEEVTDYTIRGSVYELASWARGDAVASATRERALDASYVWGSVVAFGEAGNSRPYQGTGWKRPSRSSTWTYQARSTLLINFAPATGDVELVAEVKARFPPEAAESLEVLVSVAGREVGRWRITETGFHQEALRIGAGQFATAGPREIEFRLLDTSGALAFRSVALREASAVGSLPGDSGAAPKGRSRRRPSSTR